MFAGEGRFGAIISFLLTLFFCILIKLELKFKSFRKFIACFYHHMRAAAKLLYEACCSERATNISKMEKKAPAKRNPGFFYRAFETDRNVMAHDWSGGPFQYSGASMKYFKLLVGAVA